MGIYSWRVESGASRLYDYLWRTIIRGALLVIVAWWGGLLQITRSAPICDPDGTSHIGALRVCLGGKIFNFFRKFNFFDRPVAQHNEVRHG
jgi:hypothetical protein